MQVVVRLLTIERGKRGWDERDKLKPQPAAKAFASCLRASYTTRITADASVPFDCTLCSRVHRDHREKIALETLKHLLGPRRQFAALPPALLTPGLGMTAHAKTDGAQPKLVASVSFSSTRAYSAFLELNAELLQLPGSFVAITHTALSTGM